MPDWTLLCLVAAAGGFLQGLTGFGSILLCLPLASLFLPIKTIIPLVALYALCINLYHCLTLRAHLRPRRLAVLLAATLPGLPLGVWALAVAPEWALTLLVGALITPFALQGLLLRPAPRPLGPGWAALAGFLAGFLGGSIGANGPPVIVYATLQPWSRKEIKVLMAGYFLSAGVLIAAGHALGGMTTSRVLLLFAASVPALAAGVGLGVAAFARLGERGYRTTVYLVVLAMGLLMLARGLLAAA